MLLQSGTRKTGDQLAEELNVSRRTLFRDLGVLQQAGVPYFHDPQKGYGIEADFFMPPVNLQLSEALGLLLLAESASKTVDQPFMAPAIEGVNKIAAAMPSFYRQATAEMLSRVSFQPASRPVVESDREHFVTLQQAIEEQLYCDMTYGSLFDAKTLSLRLRPYHLHFAVRSWYVIGHSEYHGEVRTFKLSRIGRLDLTQQRFRANGRFDIETYLGRAWSLIPEGRIYHIELEFSPMVGANVSEVIWHPTQKERLLDDGRCIMTFEIDGINEISWWLLGYGDQVRVIKPAALRERLRHIHAEAIKTLERDSTVDTP